MSSLIEKFNEIKVHFEKGHLIGVDIGLNAIKLVLISELKKNKFRLDTFCSVRLSEAAIIEDEIQKPDEIINKLRKLLVENKMSKRVACLGMNGPNTVTKRIQVPDGPKEEVEDNIVWESEQYIPFGVDDAEVGFSILGKNEEEDVVDAIVGAARYDIVEKYSSYLKQAGLISKIVDLNVFALVNVFEHAYQSKLEVLSREGALIIDFGAQYTTVIVYKNGGPLLTKEIPNGGVLLTEEIQRTMGVSYEEAEDLKIHGDDNGNLPEEILIILEKYNVAHMEELKKVLNFYIAAGSSEQAGFCFVTGGSARLPGIQESLQELIGMEVAPVDIMSFLEVSPKMTEAQKEELSYCGLVALGLSMRKI